MFQIWTLGIESLEQFAVHATNIHKNIKVDLRWSKECIEVLDTWLLICNRLLPQGYINLTQTDMYIQRRHVQETVANNLV